MSEGPTPRDWTNDLGDDGRIFERLVFEADVLVDFYQEHQILLDDAWWPVVRFSWSRGRILMEDFSRGSFTPSPRVQEFGEFADIWDGRNYAYDAMSDEDGIDQRMRRYLDG